MSRLIAPLFGCLALAALAMPQAHADVLLIERVEAAHGRVLPQRGQPMAQVETQFGTPSRKHAAVGGGSPQHPPITRWDYPEFSVYFEHSHVVNTVIRKASPLETGPKPAQ
ncbi:MAG: hypothetical protein WCZ65_10945 [Lysobacteraceae bacterium]